MKNMFALFNYAIILYKTEKYAQAIETFQFIIENYQ